MQPSLFGPTKFILEDTSAQEMPPPNNHNVASLNDCNNNVQQKVQFRVTLNQDWCMRCKVLHYPGMCRFGKSNSVISYHTMNDSDSSTQRSKTGESLSWISRNTPSQRSCKSTKDSSIVESKVSFPRMRRKQGLELNNARYSASDENSDSDAERQPVRMSKKSGFRYQDSEGESVRRSGSDDLHVCCEMTDDQRSAMELFPFRCESPKVAPPPVTRVDLTKSISPKFTPPEMVANKKRWSGRELKSSLSQVSNNGLEIRSLDLSWNRDKLKVISLNVPKETSSEKLNYLSTHSNKLRRMSLVKSHLSKVGNKEVKAVTSGKTPVTLGSLDVQASNMSCSSSKSVKSTSSKEKVNPQIGSEHLSAWSVIPFDPASSSSIKQGKQKAHSLGSHDSIRIIPLEAEEFKFSSKRIDSAEKEERVKLISEAYETKSLDGHGPQTRPTCLTDNRTHVSQPGLTNSSDWKAPTTCLHPVLKTVTSSLACENSGIKTSTKSDSKFITSTFGRKENAGSSLHKVLVKNQIPSISEGRSDTAVSSGNNDKNWTVPPTGKGTTSSSPPKENINIEEAQTPMLFQRMTEKNTQQEELESFSPECIVDQEPWLKNKHTMISREEFEDFSDGDFYESLNKSNENVSSDEPDAARIEVEGLKELPDYRALCRPRFSRASSPTSSMKNILTSWVSRGQETKLKSENKAAKKPTKVEKEKSTREILKPVKLISQSDIVNKVHKEAMESARLPQKTRSKQHEKSCSMENEKSQSVDESKVMRDDDSGIFKSKEPNKPLEMLSAVDLRDEGGTCICCEEFVDLTGDVEELHVEHTLAPATMLSDEMIESVLNSDPNTVDLTLLMSGDEIEEIQGMNEKGSGCETMNKAITSSSCGELHNNKDKKKSVKEENENINGGDENLQRDPQIIDSEKENQSNNKDLIKKHSAGLLQNDVNNISDGSFLDALRTGIGKNLEELQKNNMLDLSDCNLENGEDGFLFNPITEEKIHTPQAVLVQGNVSIVIPKLTKPYCFVVEQESSERGTSCKNSSEIETYSMVTTGSVEIEPVEVLNMEKDSPEDTNQLFTNMKNVLSGCGAFSEYKKLKKGNSKETDNGSSEENLQSVKEDANILALKRKIDFDLDSSHEKSFDILSPKKTKLDTNVMEENVTEDKKVVSSEDMLQNDLYLSDTDDEDLNSDSPGYQEGVDDTLIQGFSSESNDQKTPPENEEPNSDEEKIEQMIEDKLKKQRKPKNFDLLLSESNKFTNSIRIYQCIGCYRKFEKIQSYTRHKRSCSEISISSWAKKWKYSPNSKGLQNNIVSPEKESTEDKKPVKKRNKHMFDQLKCRFCEKVFRTSKYFYSHQPQCPKSCHYLLRNTQKDSSKKSKHTPVKSQKSDAAMLTKGSPSLYIYPCPFCLSPFNRHSKLEVHMEKCNKRNENPKEDLTYKLSAGKSATELICDEKGKVKVKKNLIIQLEETSSKPLGTSSKRKPGKSEPKNKKSKDKARKTVVSLGAKSEQSGETSIVEDKNKEKVQTMDRPLKGDSGHSTQRKPNVSECSTNTGRKRNFSECSSIIDLTGVNDELDESYYEHIRKVEPGRYVKKKVCRKTLTNFSDIMLLPEEGGKTTESSSLPDCSQNSEIKINRKAHKNTKKIKAKSLEKCCNQEKSKTVVLTGTSHEKRKIGRPKKHLTPDIKNKEKVMGNNEITKEKNYDGHCAEDDDVIEQIVLKKRGRPKKKKISKNAKKDAVEKDEIQEKSKEMLAQEVSSDDVKTAERKNVTEVNSLSEKLGNASDVAGKKVVLDNDEKEEICDKKNKKKNNKKGKIGKNKKEKLTKLLKEIIGDFKTDTVEENCTNQVCKIKKKKNKNFTKKTHILGLGQISPEEVSVNAASEKTSATSLKKDIHKNQKENKNDKIQTATSTQSKATQENIVANKFTTTYKLKERSPTRSDKYITTQQKNENKMGETIFKKYILKELSPKRVEPVLECGEKQILIKKGKKKQRPTYQTVKKVISSTVKYDETTSSGIPLVKLSRRQRESGGRKTHGTDQEALQGNVEDL